MAELTEFSIGQGETFKILITIQNNSNSLPLSITDYTFTGQVRENYTTDEVAANFTFTKLAPNESGSLFIELTPEQTSLFTQRRYVYDINITSGSVVRRILEGPFTVRPSATR
jgi:hypothetical protein